METILFVCGHNSGRSQMAEAFLNQMAGGTVIAISAGTQPDSEINPTVREAMREIGIEMTGQTPKILTRELIVQADRVITMGCGVDERCPVSFVATEDWGLDDPAGQSLIEVRQIRNQIKKRVEQLAREIVPTYH